MGKGVVLTLTILAAIAAAASTQVANHWVSPSSSNSAPAKSEDPDTPSEQAKGDIALAKKVIEARIKTKAEADVKAAEADRDAKVKAAEVERDAKVTLTKAEKDLETEKAKLGITEAAEKKAADKLKAEFDKAAATNKKADDMLDALKTASLKEAKEKAVISSEEYSKLESNIKQHKKDFNEFIGPFQTIRLQEVEAAEAKDRPVMMENFFKWKKDMEGKYLTPKIKPLEDRQKELREAK